MTIHTELDLAIKTANDSAGAPRPFLTRLRDAGSRRARSGRPTRS